MQTRLMRHANWGDTAIRNQQWRRLQNSQLIPRSSVPNYNPQNTPQAEVLPSPSLSADDTVKAQLLALQNNNEPWYNHGVQVAYEFGEDIGGLDPSYYFGFRKDLYHMDHFMGQFANQLPELINSSSFQIESVTEHSEEDAECPFTVRVRIVDSTGKKEGVFDFLLKRKRVGAYKGALMTKSIIRIPDAS